jgi:DNA-binding beta-propeller fold protein YncE
MERFEPDFHNRPLSAEGAPVIRLALGALLAGAVLVGVFFVLRTGRIHLPLNSVELHEAAVPAGGISQQVFPALLSIEISQPAGESWLLPVAAVPADEAIFVLDTGNNRVLKLDRDGAVLGIFDKSSDGRLDLQEPMALATDGKHLYIANSLAASIVVVDLSGRVEAVLPLQAAQPGETTRRPIGVAVTPDGEIVVSDANNHQVLLLDASGQLVRAVGTGTRSAGEEGFNVPGGLAVDGAGNVYVVDTLNGRVVELSPDGAFVRQFGDLGSTAGTLSRPKGVAVDGAGRVFVSDGLLAAVQVFAPDGAFLGIIGRRDPADAAGGSLFQAPAGLWLDGDRLYVTDRFAGVMALRLTGATPGG